jgi:hypothetical protein
MRGTYHVYELTDPRDDPPGPRYVYFGRHTPDELWSLYQRGLFRNDWFRELDACGLTPRLGMVRFGHNIGLSASAAKHFRDGYCHIAARGIPRLQNELQGRPDNLTRAVIATDRDGNETYYPSIAAAAADGHCRRDIHYCLAGARRSHHKLSWSYATDRRQVRPVERVSPDGGVTHFDSLSSATRAGFRRDDIRRYIESVEPDRTGCYWRWAGVVR